MDLGMFGLEFMNNSRTRAWYSCQYDHETLRYEQCYKKTISKHEKKLGKKHMFRILRVIKKCFIKYFNLDRVF